MKRKMISLMLTATTICMMTVYGNVGTEITAEAAESSIDNEKEIDFSGITLKWYFGTAINETMVDQIIIDFKEETGATIEWESAGEGAAVLKSRFAAGEAPDVFALESTDALEEWEDHLYDLSDELWVDLVYDSAKEAGIVDNQFLGLPISSEACGIIYNKDLFEQAGITEIPDTLTELEEVCKKLQEAGIQAFGETYMDYGFAAHALSAEFAYELELNPDVVEGFYTKEKSLNDFTMTENWFKYIDLTLNYGCGKNSITYSVDDQIADFASGKIAMIKQGTWLADTFLSTNPDINFGLMAIPLTNNAEETKLMVSSSTNLMCVNKNSENLDAALYFVQWFVENAQTYLVELGNSAPPYEGVDTSSLSALHQDMNRYISDNMAFDGFGWEDWPSGFSEDLLAPIQAYCAGQADAEATNDTLTEMFYTRLD
ncbi:MAG: extracellular solute-binding protein [Lachnospiraceae bacterium]|nr:extracellular solute-binding protein [Lachnospiraceae bacterium]